MKIQLKNGNWFESDRLMYINKPLLVHNLYLDGGLVYAIADDERAKILRVIGSMIEITPTLGINMKFINGMDDTALTP